VKRLRAEDGFTVVEMLVVMIVLSAVVAGALMLMQVVVRQSGGVVTRTEAAQRGRLTLDAITRQIRSQVCLNETTGGLISASPTKLVFYADLQGGQTPMPVRRELEYLSAKRQIVQRVHPFGGGAAQETILLDNVTAPADRLFTYKRYPDTLPADPEPNVTLAAGTVPAADLRRVALIDIAFTVQPIRGQVDLATPLADSVLLRNADPNATTPDPTCI
jgi:prepilin-type N-terminal cleavage/methylation domain-containing protein